MFIEILPNISQSSGCWGKLKGKIDKNSCPDVANFLVGENINKKIAFELYRTLESDKQCEK